MSMGSTAVALLLGGLFAVTPTSTNFTLRDFDFGGGGGTGSSTNYKLNGISGTQTGDPAASTNYTNKSGLAQDRNSNVPPAPTFTNPSSYSNQLQLVINTGNNPSDTKFAVTISPDNFASVTRYVKSDNSIGTTLVSADYRTYAGWGSGSGVLVTGLSASTTYTVKVKAMQGEFTETGYGPTAQASTTGGVSLSFAVETTTDPTPPFSVSFASLAIGTVFNSDADASLSITSNAPSGVTLYIADSNAGLTSTAASHTLASATADLSAVAKGYGAIVVSTSQSSGGPFTVQSPFNGSGNNVGALTTSLQKLATTSGSVTGGNVTVRFKAKTDVTVPNGNDYADTLTFVAAAAF